MSSDRDGRRSESAGKIQEMYVLYVELKTIACVEAIAKDLAGLGDVRRVEENVYKEQAGCAMFTCNKKCCPWR